MKLDTTGMIRVTGVDLRKLVKAVYDNSDPQGLGHLHYRAGGLPDEEVERIVGHVPLERTGNILYMDYVHGRACKFGLWRCHNNHLWIRREWFDHSEFQLYKMLKEAGVKDLESADA